MFAMKNLINEQQHRKDKQKKQKQLIKYERVSLAQEASGWGGKGKVPSSIPCTHNNNNKVLKYNNNNNKALKRIKTC